jgi:hypothetical protein
MTVDVGILLVRVLFGAAIAAHGAQKVFGWFGGYGLSGGEPILAESRGPDDWRSRHVTNIRDRVCDPTRHALPTQRLSLLGWRSTAEGRLSQP